MDGLVSRCEQCIEAKFTRAMSKTSRQRTPEKLRRGVVDKLQRVVPIERKERCVHDLKNARKKSRGLKRADTLPLKEVGQRIDLAGQFSNRIRRTSATSAKRVVAFAKRRDYVGKSLQRPHQSLNK